VNTADQCHYGEVGMSAPLSGVTVVSIEQAVSVPFASRQLADLGATVLKIERRDGGDFARHYDGNVSGQSSFFVWTNRGKSSVPLDTKLPEDRAYLDALLAGADVYLINLAPDAALRAGLDVDTIRWQFPSIIAGCVSGYGEGGPRSADKAYDLAIQAEAGVFDVTGNGDQRSKVGLSIADIAAGMYLFSGVLAALFRRERTGEGATVKVSMLDALAEWMQAPLLNAHAVGSTPTRTDRRHATIAPYGTFQLQDGSEVLLAIQNNAEFERLCRIVLLQPELATDSRFAMNEARVRNIEILESIVSAAFVSAEGATVLDRLQQADVATARVNTLAEVWQHEQLRTRGRFVETILPGGAVVETLKLPVDIDGHEARASYRVPALGEHQT
jgi:itaconate CoA-transferase